MKPLIIFGTGDFAELVNYYFSNYSAYEPIAFVVDKEHINSEEFCGLPILPFEYILDIFPQKDYSVFVAIGYSESNKIRKEKYLQIKEMGYELATYVDHRSSVMTDKIGDNCFIFEDNTIQPFVTIGNNVILWSGNHIGHHSTIDDHTFISSHVVVSGRCRIGESCFLGVNSTIRDGITIGDSCIIGASTLILSDTKSGEVYKGIKSDGIQKIWSIPNNE
jgi:sugar O-acyltransferase (sialic acid O-acetyltransferase NeuD family)